MPSVRHEASHRPLHHVRSVSLPYCDSRSSAILIGSAHAIKGPRIDEDFYVHPDRRGTLDIMKPVYVYPDGDDNVVEPDFRAIVAKSIPEGSI